MIIALKRYSSDGIPFFIKKTLTLYLKHDMINIESGEWYPIINHKRKEINHVGNSK